MLAQRFFECLLYADDILLLAHSLNAVCQMLRICDEFATDFDVKFNSLKLVVMWISERCKVKCELMLAGYELQFFQSLKYLCVQFLAAEKLKCLVDNARLKFYRTFTAIYSMSSMWDGHVTAVLWISWISTFRQTPEKVVVSKKWREIDTNRKYHMAYLFVPFPVALDDVEGHSPNAGLIKCNSTNICATFSMVLTDTVRRAVPQK